MDPKTPKPQNPKERIEVNDYANWSLENVSGLDEFVRILNAYLVLGKWHVPVLVLGTSHFISLIPMIHICSVVPEERLP